MYKICVFAGTTEGRRLVDFLSRQNVFVYACVATQYGQTLLEPGQYLTISAYRMDQGQMETLFAKQKFDLVVDATHPYATLVTQNIAAACEKTGIQYLRLLRSGDNGTGGKCFEDIAQAVEYLNQQEGNILLTTGSKELAAFSGIRDFSNRVYARVLPMEDSLRLCREAGLKPSHILAMQGPFSQEMNLAMLRSTQAAFLVTKDSGKTGGFDEKYAAAQKAGVQLLVIGRPPQGQGLSYGDTVKLLCQKFSFVVRPKVTVVGIGPGSLAAMTQQARQAIGAADCIVGAQRMTEQTAEPDQAVFHAIAPQDIAQTIRSHPEFSRFAVVMSGDVGFYSGTKKLLPLLREWDVEILPGISSLVYLCAKLGTSYEDVVPLSLHGRRRSILPDIRRHPRVFVLLGGENGLGLLCQELVEAGLGQVKVSSGQQLSYEDERITVGTAEELSQMRFSCLCVALIENSEVEERVSQGLPDEAFLRAETVPMTKSEVRSVCLSKLALKSDSICWDVGAGSGSVSIEMARQAYRGQVYAIECKSTALELLEQNRKHLGVDNLTIVPGKAPEACKTLPMPTHAFIGGSGGNMRQILTLLLEKNPQVKIVATAVTLESQAELTNCLKAFPFAKTEVVCLTVAKDRPTGPYRLMTGQNPVYIFTMQQ